MRAVFIPSFFASGAAKEQVALLRSILARDIGVRHLVSPMGAVQMRLMHELAQSKGDQTWLEPLSALIDLAGECAALMPGDLVVTYHVPLFKLFLRLFAFRAETYSLWSLKVIFILFISSFVN